MPGQAFGVVRQKIIGIEIGPETFDALHRRLAGFQVRKRFTLEVGDVGLAVNRFADTAAQQACGGAVELRQQPALPGIPHDRTGPAHVGDRQQIEIIEMFLIADLLGEVLHYVRVGDVLTLRGL